MIMKKVINSLFVIIAAMVTFAGCAKQEIDAPATSETKTVQFFANSIETKTVFGTPNDGVYPTLWSAGDEVKVLLNIEQVAGTEAKVPVTCDDLAVSSTFEASFQPKDTPETYTYYAVCPANQYNAKSSKDGRITVIIPSEQEPLETTVDKKAQIIYAVATADAEQGSVDMDFHHLTAYGKLTLKNLPEDISVSEVKIVAPDDLYISGKWNYLVADGSIAAHKEATMNTLTIKTTRTTDIWFACGPVDVSGKTLTLTVTTNQGDFVKELNFPANRKFEAGKISKFTVDMAGIEVEGSEEPEQPGETTAYYEKVTSEPTDWSGKYLLVVEDGVNKALSGISTTSTKYGLAQDVKINDAKIIASEELSAYEVVIAKASTSGAYTMAFDSSLLYWTSGNSLAVNSTESANTSWTISLDNGKLSIYNCKDSARQLLWNKNSPRFACYTGKATDAGYYYPHLYKLVGGSSEGGGETPEPDPTPDPEEPEEPEEPIVATIAEFLAAEKSDVIYYQLTGIITNIASSDWGNLTIKDASESVYIYGLTKEQKTSNDKSFSSLGLKVGDQVTLITVRGEHNGTPQGGGTNTPAYYVSHIPSCVAPTISCVDNKVTIEAEVGATVYYTTNGTTPTVSSTTYTAPFDITSTVTVKAIAVAPEKMQSSVAEQSCTYVDLNAGEGDAPSEPITITLDLSKNLFNLSTSKANDASSEVSKTYEGYTYKFKASESFYYFGSKAMFLGKKDSYITFPAISGYKLASVQAHNCSGASSKGTIVICGTSNSTAVSGGTASTILAGESTTWTLSSTAANTSYRFYITNANAVQLTKLVLTYQPAN